MNGDSYYESLLPYSGQTVHSTMCKIIYFVLCLLPGTLPNSEILSSYRRENESDSVLSAETYEKLLPMKEGSGYGNNQKKNQKEKQLIYWNVYAHLRPFTVCKALILKQTNKKQPQYIQHNPLSRKNDKNNDFLTFFLLL